MVLHPMSGGVKAAIGIEDVSEVSQECLLLKLKILMMTGPSGATCYLGGGQQPRGRLYASHPCWPSSRDRPGEGEEESGTAVELLAVGCICLAATSTNRLKC